MKDSARGRKSYFTFITEVSRARCGETNAWVSLEWNDPADIALNC